MGYLRALRRLLTLVPWACNYCQQPNETPLLLWNTVKYHLYCQRCGYAQNYPDYIRLLDPEPRDPLPHEAA